MAETVLSMARSLLGSTVKIAATAAASELSMLIGVRKDIWFINDELKTMQAFLVSAEAMENKDLLLKVWAEQVRDLSYAIEDCLDEFMVHVQRQSLSRRLMKLKDRRRIAIQIRDLKSRVEEVSSRYTRYKLIDREISNTTDERGSFMEDIRNQAAHNINEAELVGFSKPKQELTDLVDVHAMDGPTRVVCVVGMGGLGKSTITRQVYGSMKNFSCCAWIVVSQSFVRVELLKVLIKELFGEEALKKQLEGKVVREEDLGIYLKTQLKKRRYCVVLDDLWNLHHWNWIREIAFPSDNMEGSRIMVTTRDIGLAKECTFGTCQPLIFPLQALEEDDARDLLLRKTRKTHDELENDEKLKNMVTKIVKKCGCLPLAILTVGGMLATKKVIEWDSIYNQLPGELERNPSLEAMRRVVTLSYSQLPSHLKSCFLYLSIFPEDYEIKRKRLIERWIAEGFVRASAGMTVEDVGKTYFTELINRSMILPSRVNIEGIVKSCRVHDIMRDVMVSISTAEKFVYLAVNNATGVEEKNFRHVAYHGSKCPKIGVDWSHIRSITLFGERPMEPSTSLCSPELRMLRALDLEDAQFEITQKDINSIGLLRHLKYLKVRKDRGYSNIYDLPRSIGKLQGLQTVDMGDTYISTLPREITELHSLRNLRCTKKHYYRYRGNCRMRCLMNMLCLPVGNCGHDDDVIAELHMARSSSWSECEGISLPRGISNLKELQVLEFVDIKRTSSEVTEELGELTQLKRLRVITEGATKEKCKILSAVIGKLCSLSFLSVDASRDEVSGVELEWLHFVSSPPPLLRTLKLVGYIGGMPNWFGNLIHLVKLYLRYSQLEDKTMEILGALPNLMLLRLHRDAYVGDKIVLKAEAFQNLRQLDVFYLGRLREIRFEEGTSPHMETIRISYCKISSGINGIKHLPRLKQISLGHGGRANLDMLQGEVDSHPNHPVLQLTFDRKEHDVGQAEGSNVEVEATEGTSIFPEPAAGESSEVVMPTMSNSEDDLLYTFNSC